MSWENRAKLQQKWWLPGCFLKWWYPQNHPKMIISSRKTHGCWGYHHLGKHPPRPSGCFKEKKSVFETGLLRPNISTYRLEDSGMKHHKNPSLLVGGFSPSEKYACQIGSFPQGRDEHKKNMQETTTQRFMNLNYCWREKFCTTSDVCRPCKWEIRPSTVSHKNLSILTPQKTNMEPENEPLEEEIPLSNHHFQVPS